MKVLFKGQKHTTYDIAKHIGKRPDYLYKYINKQANINNMSLSLALAIAKYEDLTVEEFYKKVKAEK